MKNATTDKYTRTATQARPTLMVAGGVCALLANPAMGVELGEIQVQSALGQPLRASIAIALAPNEQISDQCVYLRSAAPVRGLPTINRATTTISGNQILLRGNTALREPMMSLQVAVNCPYTAKVQREYLLMLNPPALHEAAQRTEAPAVDTRQAPQQAEVAAPPAPAVRRPVNVFEPAPAVTQTDPAPAVAQREPVQQTPVDAGSDYRVQVGDTLSEIASRIPNRSVNLWSAVNSIHAANPGAFLDGDVNRLVAGSVLSIPAAVTGGEAVNVPSAVTAARPAAVQQSERLGDSTPAATESASVSAPAAEPATVSEPATVATGQPEQNQATTATVAASPDESATVVETVQNSNAGADLEATPAPSPFVEEAGALQPAPAPQQTVGIPNTRIQQVAPPPAQVVPVEEGPNSSSWLVMLGGTGIAIFLALLLFGGRLRELFGSRSAVASVGDSQVGSATPPRKRSLEATQLFTRRLSELFSNREAEAPAQSASDGYEVEEPLADNEATAEINLDETIGKANALKIEEDLNSGNVFDTGHDLNVALDYSFASSGDHSNELDFVVDGDKTDAATDAGAQTEVQATEIMPVEPAEVPPVNEDDSYSMSMVLDVTKQNFMAPGRAQDLQATQVTPTGEAASDADALDMTSEFDLKILEQDYEDELTAKMALGDDMSGVVRDLKDQGIDLAVDDNDSSMAVDLDATAEITAEMPQVATNSEETLIDDATLVACEDDETDLTEALAASLESLERDMADTDVTERLDLDAELELESTIDQHKSKLG